MEAMAGNQEDEVLQYMAYKERLEPRGLVSD